MKKKLSIVIIFAYILILLVTMVPVSAKENYDTYTYSSQGDILYSPATYTPFERIDSKYMELSRYREPFIAKYTEVLMERDGLDAEKAATNAKNFADATDTNVSKLGSPTDIVTDSRGYVYLADASKNRIVILTESYKFYDVIDYFESNVADYDSFNNPRGLYVTEEHIFVCDTNNFRLVVFNRDDLSFSHILEKPDSALFNTGNQSGAPGDEKVAYTPIACAVDKYGRIFVVSDSCNKGIIVLGSDGEFTGFIGAQKVTYNLIDIFWQKFQSEEAKKNNLQNIPTTFNNVTVDEKGFVFATIKFSSSEEQNKQMASIQSKDAAYSPVKKLNGGGKQVMSRNGFFDCGGEVVVTAATATEGLSGSGVSMIVDVAIGPEGSWTIADESRSRIYTYNKYGELLFAFGDSGKTLGATSQLRGVVYQGDNLLLLDFTSCAFTVFTRTTYGDVLINALAMENAREYETAEENWLKILESNTNFDAAYIGVGKALYRQGKYTEAMEYFKAAHETSYYSDAFAALRKEWLSKFFILVVIIVIVLLVLVVKGLGAAKRFNSKTALKVGKKSYWEELVYAFHLVFHPFDGFWDLKHEKRGSLRAGLTIVGLTIVTFYYNAIGKGYIFDPYESVSTIIIQIISIMVPVLLWTTANWCLTTLFDGEGSFKDVLVAVCYSCAPLPPMLIISTILTNVLTLDEGAIATMLITFAFVWVAFLLFFGMLVTHDYTLPKNILTTFGTILSMVIIMFIILLFSSLVGKMIQFVSSIVSEISFRV